MIWLSKTMSKFNDQLKYSELFCYFVQLFEKFKACVISNIKSTTKDLCKTVISIKPIEI